MASRYTNVLLVTANVGSIFEDPDKMLKMWLQEFLGCVSRLQPAFLAVHCQEVGGKNYEESMQYVNDFIKALLASDELECYDKGRVFLDEDFTAADKFTALGCIYFVHENVKDLLIWNFDQHQFVAVDGKEVLSGNIESVPIKEKAKFPKEFFPECRWSRKGFIRTRWMVNSSVFDLVNIHLFHDASNFVAMESSPSSYVHYRQKALEYTLNRLENDHLENVPMFIFGDFNFRLDTQKLIQRLTEKATMHSTKNKKNELSKVIYKDKVDSEKMVLTVEKKAFDHHDCHNRIFSEEKWLKDYDLEFRAFHDRLYEFEVTFPPSYPYSEDIDDGTSYMKTRCPSWCDRIVMTHSAKDCMTSSMPAEYSVIGPANCMGDHKPVYLHFHMRQGTGKLPMKTSPILRRRLISINGEELMGTALENIDIHENAIFEKEQELHPDIRRSLKGRKHESQNGRPGTKSKATFSDVARDVMRAEGVISALKWHHKRRRHNSSSASSDDDESLSSEPHAGVEESKADDGIGRGTSSQFEIMESNQSVDYDDKTKLIDGGSIQNFPEPSNEMNPNSAATEMELQSNLHEADNTNLAHGDKYEGTRARSSPPAGGVHTKPVLTVVKKSGMCPCSCEVQ